jgi:hypothetical protein|tara:strand:- start:1186 stop:1494 length:309 start_codon:yes stop_codon:yes gene_type:complete
MRLPIEQQAKIAANDFVIIDVQESGFRGKVAMPESWYNYGGDIDNRLPASEASKVRNVFFLAPGSLKSALKDMDDLHALVNDVYTLVDEGYVDGNKAILAFR